MKRKWIYITCLLVLLIGSVLYGLAKRYLIPRVELDLDQLQQAQQSEQSKAGDDSSDESSKRRNDTDQSSEEEQQQEQAEYDDWSYQDEHIQIQISQHEQGIGDDRITYYVADVQLSDAAYLQTALAHNQFGRNIVDYTSAIAADNAAVLAINGDYYGFRSDGIVIRNGLLLRDEGARTGMAIYKDGTVQSYDETKVSGEQLIANGAVHTFSFGPVLVENGVAYTDFDHVMVDTNFGNRSIQNANPRTGFGYIAPNHYAWIVVDGRKEGYSRGMTLNEFAQLFEQLGAQLAYNLDGGGSSTLVFMGNVVNNPLGKQREREVSDIIFIGQSAAEEE